MVEHVPSGNRIAERDNRPVEDEEDTSNRETRTWQWSWR
jgi:hypothetical protein